MRRFARGSEWRKWDLHIHSPGTKQNDRYAKKEGKPDWDRFCRIIHESDVQAIGITDYFSLDNFFNVKEKYRLLYPRAEKVLFPNLELRLNESVNTSSEFVNFHIIFPPTLSSDTATKFLNSLKTQITDENNKQRSCAELKTSEDFKKATVSRDDIKEAIENTFGKKIITDHCLLITAASDIRVEAGNKRKKPLADEIDKFSDGFFGNPKNTDYYLNPNRLKDPDPKIPPKPVFSCCDAHSFDELENWLGKEVTGNYEKHVTWVKADLTFEGLQQTFIEPAERVRIQTTAPDKKEPYKVISKITFKDSDLFPSEVVFNPGLNAIIGSRSSGKSALLSYVAHAVDPDYTVSQQVAVTDMNERDVGPGASVTWTDVKDIEYSIEWAAASAATGRVIFIPQNSLFKISARPDEITAKIQPTVFRKDPGFAVKFRKTKADVEIRNELIRNAVDKWFTLAKEMRTLSDEIRNLGDRDAIAQRQIELEGEIKQLQESSTLTDEEVKVYQILMEEIGKNENRVMEIEQEQIDLDPYVTLITEPSRYEATDEVAVNISMTPNIEMLPGGLQIILQALLDSTETELLEKVKSYLTEYRVALDSEQRGLIETNEKLRRNNKDLIEKNLANVQIAGLVKNLADQKESQYKIDGKVILSNEKKIEQLKLLSSIGDYIKDRELMMKALAEDFNLANLSLEDMTFKIEIEYNSEDIDRISGGFNKRENSPFIDNGRVNIVKSHSEAGNFVEYMGSGKQKLNQGVDAVALAKTVLTTTKDVRFVAYLEDDRIGGFQKSSMTQGKQALFALRLILAESEEHWPLLIDQPEDDLDSRSVCDVIVKDLMKRKRERQIIMVSHNANLVIGADSEEIIVANRHGDDRPNRDNKRFAYLTGSLEHSKPKDQKERCVLDCAGIREHACDILDGGAEAFQKRKDKYRI
ncbi:MAG: TrlF family AAA-like ATPase [Syntrophaceae bacterium]